MIRRTGLQDPSQQCDGKFINQSNNCVMFIHSTQLEDIMLKKYCYLLKILHSTLMTCNSVIAYFGDQLQINIGDLAKTWKVLRVILGLGSNTPHHIMNFFYQGQTCN